VGWAETYSKISKNVYGLLVFSCGPSSPQLEMDSYNSAKINYSSIETRLDASETKGRRKILWVSWTVNK